MITWQPISTAPKTPTPKPRHPVRGIYILGFCPDESALDPQSCIYVVWWEPHLNGGVWVSEISEEMRPTHWHPLPEAPKETP